MKDKTEKKFKRMATVVLVISVLITLILMATGGVRRGGDIFLIVFVLCAIAVGVLYFPVKWGYNGLKRIYAKDKFFFRLMIVLSSLISIPMGVISGITVSDTYSLNLGIIRITNPIAVFFMTFAACVIPVFIVGFSIIWVRGGSKRSQFYLRLTAVLSIVCAIIGALIAALDVSINEFFYDSGVSDTFTSVKVRPSITSVWVGAICCAGVWIIYLSILWVYRGLDSDDTE